MSMVIELLIVGIVFVVFNYFYTRKVNKTEDNVERIFESVLLIIFDTFLAIYYVDRFNLPTILGMNANVNTQNWLLIISNGASGFISASIGGLIAFGVARSQIVQNNEQNKENNRIQNMPLFQYNIESKYFNNGIEEKEMVPTDIEDNPAELFNVILFVKNIGLNSAKQVIVDFNSDFTSQKLRLTDNTQTSIEKGKGVEIRRFFRLNREHEYQIELNVYYEDVLQNWYLQEVKVRLDTPRQDAEPIASISYVVQEEKMISRENIPI